MIRCDRSGDFMGEPVDISDSDGQKVLIKCILAGLVLPDSDTGSIMGHQIVTIDGTPRVLISVDGQGIVLGEQTVGPQRDHLVGRATVVHMARRADDQTWGYCYKSSWPYASRQHEGVVLQELQVVAGVVRLLTWDAPQIEGNMTVDQVSRDYMLRNGDNDSEQYHPREFRQVVVEYIELSIQDTGQSLYLPGILQAWRSLYTVVNDIAAVGWVHRDLSWTNVRLIQNGGQWSVKLIDFDLANRIDGPSSGAPDKTGTLTFMPLEILSSNGETPVRHQELHEDEAVFWIFFYLIICRSDPGRKEYNKLLVPGLALELICDKKKGTLLTLFFQKGGVPSWFEVSLRPVVGQPNFVRELCYRIAQTQYTSNEGDNTYSYARVDTKDMQGNREHKLQHVRVFKGVVWELDRALLIIQRGGDDEMLDAV